MVVWYGMEGLFPAWHGHGLNAHGSSLGDVRMLFGENPNKVRNIVAAQRDLLHNMYVPVALGPAFSEHVAQLADGSFQVCQ